MMYKHISVISIDYIIYYIFYIYTMTLYICICIYMYMYIYTHTHIYIYKTLDIYIKDHASFPNQIISKMKIRGEFSNLSGLEFNLQKPIFFFIHGQQIGDLT